MEAVLTACFIQEVCYLLLHLKNSIYTVHLPFCHSFYKVVKIFLYYLVLLHLWIVFSMSRQNKCSMCMLYIFLQSSLVTKKKQWCKEETIQWIKSLVDSNIVVMFFMPLQSRYVNQTSSCTWRTCVCLYIEGPISAELLEIDNASRQYSRIHWQNAHKTIHII